MRRPDVVLIVVDTLRADHLGVYGYPRDTSPHLDRFAASAVVFERAVSTSPWTLPSVASILTARYPTVHGLRFRKHDGAVSALPAGLPTLAGVFAARGYRTVGIVTNPWVVEVAHGLERGFDAFRTPGRLVGLGGMETPAATVFDEAERELADTAGDPPLFLYLHFMDVHGPYNADVQADLGPIPERLHRPIETPPPPYLVKPGATGLDAYVDAYDRGVRAWDDAFGEWVAWMDERARLDHTVVLVTSDHGEELMERGGWGHGDTLFAEQIDVPMLLRLAGGEPRGRVDSLASLVDVGRTLLDAAGLGDAPFPGRDLLSDDAASDPTRIVLSEAVGAAASRANIGYRAIRLGRRKVVERARKLRCYDLARDPDEREPLPCTEADAARLREFVAERRRLAAAVGEGGEGTAVTPGAAERLRALGYVE